MSTQWSHDRSSSSKTSPSKVTPWSVRLYVTRPLDSSSCTRQTKFTTGESTEEDKHVGDDYFLNSGDKIRYFLEEDAVGKDGQLNRDKELAVNKIGHGELFTTELATRTTLILILCRPSPRRLTALHELDPLFRRITLKNDHLKSLARDLQFHKEPLGPSSSPFRPNLPIDSMTSGPSLTEHADIQATSDWWQRYARGSSSPQIYGAFPS